MATELFADDDCTDLVYRNIRDAKDGPLYKARRHCEYLWLFFERHADSEFRKEFRSNFQARYWEMFLTVSFILAGYSVTCPKPGPDVGITFEGNRIWFEAVSPGPGQEGSPDYVAPPKEGEVSNVPNEKMVLRYLNGISEKYERQYANWIAKGHVSKNDAFVIAVNPRNLPFEFADAEPPRILQAAYTVGNLYAVVNRETLGIVGTGYHFRDHIEKTAKPTLEGSEQKEPARVTTGVFQDRKHDALSALLCSRVDSVNNRGEFGDDFQLAPNPHATTPLPPNFCLRGTYYSVKEKETGYVITPTQR